MTLCVCVCVCFLYVPYSLLSAFYVLLVLTCIHSLLCCGCQDSRFGQNDLENYMTILAGNAVGLQQAVAENASCIKDLTVGVARNTNDIKDLARCVAGLAESVAGNTSPIAGSTSSIASTTSHIKAIVGNQATFDKVLKIHKAHIDILTQSVAALKEDARLSKRKFEEIEENQE